MASNAENTDILRAKDSSPPLSTSDDAEVDPAWIHMQAVHSCGINKLNFGGSGQKQVKMGR